MKKIILAMVFVFATGTMMNANTSIEIVNTVEEIGVASDCVKWARDLVFDAAAENGDHPNDDPVYMQAYMALYTNCYYS